LRTLIVTVVARSKGYACQVTPRLLSSTSASQLWNGRLYAYRVSYYEQNASGELIAWQARCCCVASAGRLNSQMTPYWISR
jgi:hypothetical protein